MRVSPFLASVSSVSPWCISTRLAEKAGFAATRQFRLLVISLTLAVSLVVVWIFEIGPLLSGRLPPSSAERRHAGPEPVADAGAARIPFDGLLQAVKDGTPFDEADRSYRHLLGCIERAGPEALPGKGRRVGYRKILEAPALYRGQSLRVAGLYVHSDPIRIGAPVSAFPPRPPRGGDGGREWVHRTYLVDPGGDEGYVVDLLERPAFDLRSLVSVDGIFLKLAAYQGRKGPLRAPFLLGREAVPLKEAR
jgi:hypothetical protein